MSEEFDLQKYMTEGVERVVNDAIKATLKNPRESAFMLRFAAASSGGCVAAGRGFFHINSHGGAEPCPFSPYSDVNIKDTSLREAIHSPLFTALRSGGILLDDHSGGCVLYEKRELVEALIAKSAE